MRLRKFRGPTASVALRQVKRELGEDALILATRPTESGEVEITAATDVDRVLDPLPEPPPASSALAARRDERFDALESVLHGFGRQIRRIDRRLAAAGARRELDGEGAFEELPPEPRSLAVALSEHGLGAEVAARIAERFAARRAMGEGFDDAAAGAIQDWLPRLEGTPAANVRFLVGPTGSGKTTTIAKLAAEDVLAGKRPVLLMADTARIGAAEQLAGFARLLDVPMYTVARGEDVTARVEAVSPSTPVYVDTAGLSGDDAMGRFVRELVSAAGQRASVTAVVSATAATSSLQRAWSQLAVLRPESCAITHMDESDEPGIACSWLEDVGLPLRWIGTGQRVPDDLAHATGPNLALWLLVA